MPRKKKEEVEAEEEEEDDFLPPLEEDEEEEGNKKKRKSTRQKKSTTEKKVKTDDSLLKEGQEAPDFEAQDANGNKVSLSSFKGKKVVLYFYPKDNTPGCKKEAIAFTENLSKFEEKGIQVLGVSSDTVKSHLNFTTKAELKHTLLSDTNLDIITKYNAVSKRSGKTAQRITYVIGEDGKILKVYPKVKPEEHASQILKEIDSLKPVTFVPSVSDNDNEEGDEEDEE
ncbi:hypothetical protein ABK040_016565 [Willaertia magna]